MTRSFRASEAVLKVEPSRVVSRAQRSIREHGHGVRRRWALKHYGLGVLLASYRRPPTATPLNGVYGFRNAPIVFALHQQYVRYDVLADDSLTLANPVLVPYAQAWYRLPCWQANPPCVPMMTFWCGMTA